MTFRSVVPFRGPDKDKAAHKNTVLVHAARNYLKTVTNNVGWSVLSKTTTFGLKFVPVPILARVPPSRKFGAVALAQIVVIFLTMVGPCRRIPAGSNRQRR